MEIILQTFYWILIFILRCVDCSTDETVALPKAGQDSIKREYLQRPKEFINGIRNLADNSHIPLISMEYQIQIHNSISEIQIIQEFQNPIFSNYILAEFYYQIRVSQTFVSLEVHSNGQVLKGIILDKNKQKKKKSDIKNGEKKIIPAPYAEIIEDLHDIMRINLGFLSPGQQIKIILKYIEELERESVNTWKLTLLTASQFKDNGQSSSTCIPEFMSNTTYNNSDNNNGNTEDENKSNENTSEKNPQFQKCSGKTTSMSDQLQFLNYDWKINGQIISKEEITVQSKSHKDIDVDILKNKNNENLIYFSLDYGNNSQPLKDFVLIITEQTKEINSSKAYLGYDPQDLQNPYAALIRFSPLIHINPDENYSSCKNKLKNTNQNNLNAQNNQFLRDSEQIKYLEKNDSKNDDDDDSEDEEEDQYEQTQEEFREIGLEVHQKNKSKTQITKKNRRLLIVIEDFKINTQGSTKQNQENTDLILQVSQELIQKLPEDGKYLINILLMASKKVIFDNYADITSENKIIIVDLIISQLKLCQNVESAKLPIKTIMRRFNFEDKKIKKFYLILIGTGNYWNMNDVLMHLGSHKKLIVYAIGIGYHISFQLFQRIEQLSAGKSHIIENYDEITSKINSIIIDLNAPIFKKFSIIYDHKIVNSMTSLIDNINALSPSKSYSLYVYFNKSFQKLIKYSKKNNIKKVSFTLRVVDEDNRIYEAKAKVYFDHVLKTNAFHKLGANQQIQSYLINALYKPEGYQNLSLIRQGTTAFEKILQFSMKYQILSEVTALFLFDSEFISCSKSQNQYIENIQPYIRKLNLYESDDLDDEEEYLGLSIKDFEEQADYFAQQYKQIIINRDDESQNKKYKKEKKKQLPEYQCTININPLNLNNIIISKIQLSKKEINNQINHFKFSSLYQSKQNSQGQSYLDIERTFRNKKNQFQQNMFSLIIQIKHIIILLLQIMVC